MKGEHDQSLQMAKIGLDALKKEIEDLKAHSNEEEKIKIKELEGVVEATKIAYDKVNNDNVTLFQIFKKKLEYSTARNG